MTLEEALATIVQLTEANRRLVAMVEGLTAQLDQLLAKVGEKPPPRLELPPTPPPPPPAEKKKKATENRHQHGRGKPSAELPRDRVELPAPKSCPHCEATDLRMQGSEETTEYDFVRAHVRLRRTVRKVCLCLKCARRFTQPMPPMPFERAACTFAMMA